jgi:hypothetical protein
MLLGSVLYVGVSLRIPAEHPLVRPTNLLHHNSKPFRSKDWPGKRHDKLPMITARGPY